MSGAVFCDMLLSNMFLPNRIACSRLLPASSGVVKSLARHFTSKNLPNFRVFSSTVTEPTTEQRADAHESVDDNVPAFRAFIDFKFIRENVELVKENCARRNAAADPEAVAKLYDEYVEIKKECDAVRNARNENSKAMKGKMEQEKRQALIAKGVELKQELGVLEVKLNEIEGQLQIEGQKIPNLTHPDSPDGGEEAATVVANVGEPRKFDFKIKNHVEIGEALGLIDFDNGGVVSGRKFYYLRHAAALLEMALVNYAFQKVAGKGFTPIMTPDLVREAVLEKCGFQPRADNTQVYGIRNSDLCLTGTAEVPLGGIYMDQIIEQEKLPIKMVAFGHCFRTEAGAGGMAGKGLYRVHQFSKVEMFVIGTPEQSEGLLKELLEIEEELFADLGLHFKILDMPSGDLGAPAFRKYDIEAWMPGLDRYGEISSASNCTDYQSRRLNIRFKPTPLNVEENGKVKKKKLPNEFVHTLNATACAVPRLLVSILENFQQEDGSVIVPEALRPYMGGLDVIRPPEAA